MKSAFAVCLATVLVAGCSGGNVTSHHAGQPLPGTKRDWSALADQRVFFAHQSVGYNIVEGVTDLLKDQQKALQVTETTAAGDLKPGVLAHATVGKNGDPSSKIRGFADYMDAGLASHTDIALFKFCYIDVDASTDVDQVFTQYKQTMTTLRERYPSTRFVHVTMPLRMVQTGPKALIKRVMGKPAGGYLENVRRNRYNEMIRREYSGREPLFDLARVEATAGETQQTTFRYEGAEYFALNPSYTSDNGHLNEAGRRLVAAAFLDTLAEARRPRSN
jgi:lysophospholipase L1-like esterase